VPDNLFHDHQVPEVREAGGHEPGKDMKRGSVPDGIGDQVIIPMPDDDAAAYERRYLWKGSYHSPTRLDTKLGEESIQIDGLVV